MAAEEDDPMEFTQSMDEGEFEEADDVAGAAVAPREIVVGKLISLSHFHESIEFLGSPSSTFRWTKIVGRNGRAVDVVVDHPCVSGTHCEITFDGGAFTVMDRSSNGSWLNNARLPRAVRTPLRHGDELTLVKGAVSRELRRGQPAAPPQTPQGQRPRPAEGGTPKAGRPPHAVTFLFSHHCQSPDDLLSTILEGEHAILDVYAFDKKLGEGTFGSVYRATHRHKHDVCAAKVLSLRHLVELGDDPAKAIQEVELLHALSHPNICGVLEVFQTPKFLVIILELARGTLQDQLDEKGKFNETDAKHCFRQVCEALCYIHGRGVMHRDLKPENVLVSGSDDTVVYKISDFGLAKHSTWQTSTVCGTPMYFAPEIFSPNKHKGNVILYDAKADMWAAGVMLHQLLFGGFPFDPRLPIAQMLQQIQQLEQVPFAVPPGATPEAEGLLRRLLTPAHFRLAASDTLHHPWLSTRAHLRRACSVMARAVTQAPDHPAEPPPPPESQHRLKRARHDPHLPLIHEHDAT